MSVKPIVITLSRLFLRLSQVLVALLLALLLVLVVLLGTHQGNSFLLAAASRLEPRFAATLESGHLFDEAVLRDIRWSAPGVDLLIPQLELVIDWTCLNELTLCFERLRAQGGRMNLMGTPVAEPAEKTGRGTIELPFAVEVRSLQLQQTRLTVDDQKIALADLLLAARLDKSGLQISSLQLQGLQVELAEEVVAAANQGTAAAKDDSRQTPTLPEIELPLAIRLDNLALENGLLRRTGRDYRIHRLQLSARAAGSQLEISNLELSTPQASVRAELQLDLTAGYPLTLNAQGRLLEVPPLNGLDARLSATGSIADLTVDLSSSGPVTGRLKAAARLLEPNLPFSAHVTWLDFGWPVEQPTLHSETGQLDIDGSLEGYSFRLLGKVRGEQLPALTLAAKGDGKPGQVRIDSLHLKGLEGDAELKGVLRWGDELAWKGDFSFQGINPAELVAELPGRLSGQLGSEFLLRDGSWKLSLQQLDIDGELAGQPLRLAGDLQGSQSGEWQISQLRLLSGKNRLRVEGRLGEENDLQGELDIIDLQTSIPRTSGSAKGSFSLSGRRDALQLDFSLVAQALGYAGQKVGALDAGGQLSFAALPQGQVQILAKDIAYEDLVFESLRAALSGSRADHSLSIALQGEQFSSQSTLNGRLAEKLWSGQFQESWLDTPIGRWSLDSPLALNYALDQQQAVIDKHCWSSGDASLCLNEQARLGRAGQVSVGLQGFSSSQLAELLPAGLSWDGSLAATAVAGWAPGQKPSVEAELSAGKGRFEIDQAGQKLQADYQQLEVRAALDEAAARVSLVLRSDQLGRGDISLQLDPYQEEKTLRGEIRLTDLQLGILQPLIRPLEEIAGNVAADIRVSGQLKKPQLSGTVTVSEGHLAGASVMPLAVEQLSLQLDLDGYQAGVAGDLLLGDGPAELAGLLSWQQTPVTGWLTLKGERSKFNLAPELKLLISPDLRFELLPERLDLTGGILIPYGRIKVKKLPQGAVRLSDDVVISDDPNAAKAKQALPLSLAVEVTLLDDVAIEAFGLKAGLEGTLAIRQAANQPLSGHGSIDLYDGTYRAFGQNLLINKGALLFSGPLSKPFIDVDAVRNPESTRDNVTAGVRLRGEARNPKVTIYSDPAMSQQEAISYLLRGRSLGSSSGTSQDSMVASMLIGAGIGRTEGAISELGQVFGVDELAVDTRGEGSDTKVAVSGYLLPGVQVGYGVGLFSPVTEITLRYEILPKLVLEAVSGLQSAVDLLYEFEF